MRTCGDIQLRIFSHLFPNFAKLPGLIGVNTLKKLYLLQLSLLGDKQPLQPVRQKHQNLRSSVHSASSALNSYTFGFHCAYRWPFNPRAAPVRSSTFEDFPKSDDFETTISQNSVHN